MPIAAPSANISKHVSPVTAEHVYADLAGKVPLILDGGQCSGGIESTVCDVTGDIPVVLRSGLISQEMIESVVGCCETYTLRAGEAARSPGMKYKHYSPRCRTKLFPSEALARCGKLFSGNRRKRRNMLYPLRKCRLRTVSVRSRFGFRQK